MFIIKPYESHIFPYCAPVEIAVLIYDFVSVERKCNLAIEWECVNTNRFLNFLEFHHYPQDVMQMSETFFMARQQVVVRIFVEKERTAFMCVRFIE